MLFKKFNVGDIMMYKTSKEHMIKIFGNYLYEELCKDFIHCWEVIDSYRFFGVRLYTIRKEIKEDGKKKYSTVVLRNVPSFRLI